METIVVAEEGVDIGEARVGHVAEELARCAEEREEFVALKEDADARGGAHHLGVEVDQTTEETEVKHALRGLEGVGATEGNAVEVGFEGAIGFEHEDGATRFETESGEVFVEFGFEHASCGHATRLGEEVLTFKHGVDARVVPLSHEFALSDGLFAEHGAEEIVEDVAPCLEGCACVARIEDLCEGVARGGTEEKQRGGCEG